MSFYWLSLFSGVLSPIRLLFFPFSLPLSLFGSSFITTISLAVVSSYQIVLLAFSLHFLFPPFCSSSMTTSPFVIAVRFSPCPCPCPLSSHFLRVSHRLISCHHHLAVIFLPGYLFHSCLSLYSYLIPWISPTCSPFITTIRLIIWVHLNLSSLCFSLFPVLPSVHLLCYPTHWLVMPAYLIMDFMVASFFRGSWSLYFLFHFAIYSYAIKQNNW